MKMKNKLLCCAASAVLVLGLTACGSDIQASDIRCVDDLAGKNIGVQIGTTGDIYAADYVEQGSVVKQYNKGSDAVMALKQGKIDCIVIDYEPAKKFDEINPDISILEEDFVTEEYAICIAKENTELLESINSALGSLKEDGILDSIMNNYIGENTDGEPYISKISEYPNGTLRMATNPAFEPYEYIENGECIGIDVDIATAIADILGMKLEIQEMEFDSIIASVSTGKSDIGVAGMTVTEDRLKNINFSDPYTTSRQVILVRNGNTESTGFFSKEKFYNNFIKENRWEFITSGLVTTLTVAFFAVILGTIVGFLLAVIRFSCDYTGKFKILNAICRIYITIIRGTPSMIQLLIIYYVVFASSSIDPVIVAIAAFALNSSAYIAEIVRSGISSVDSGQFEAGRSLGFSYSATMINFILPQAIRNILPALGNEFIVLLKETSISGYIGIRDLTRGGDIIRSRTYDAFMPLVAVALIYLVIVMILSTLVGMLERRLRTDGK